MNTAPIDTQHLLQVYKIACASNLEIHQIMLESKSTRNNFPDWENLYKSQRVETMP